MSQTMVDTYKTLTYDEWIEDNKNKSKVKKTGTNGSMTAFDEKENRAMYDLYVQEINAQNALSKQKQYLENSQTAALEANAQNRANTMRENSIMTERAQEYINRRAALNGTASAGVSQTAMIDLMAQMAGARADAQSSYDNQKRSIVQDYQDALLEAQGKYDETMTNAQNVANATASQAAVSRAQLAEQKAEYTRQSRVEDIQNAIADYEAGNISFDELNKIYEDNESYVDEKVDYGIVSDYNKISDDEGKQNAFFADDSTTGLSTADYFRVSRSSAVLEPSTISLESINSLIDVDGAGSGDEQDKWVSEVVALIKKGQIKDGTIIDMNYGHIDGENKGNYFVYHNGRLYKSDLKYSTMESALKSNNKSQSASGDGEMELTIKGNTVKFLRKDD